MEQHPIPRQITTFEFKLIGFMTLKQFLYLVIFFPIAFIVFKVIPIPLLNVLLAAVIALIGVAFAFLPFRDRPLEDWVRNMIKRINSPTQYSYKKAEDPVYFLKNLYFAEDPHVVLAHVESKEKLAAYLKNRNTAQPAPLDEAHRDKQKTHIQDLLQNQQVPLAGQKNTTAVRPNTASGALRQPFIAGVIRNRKSLALPGILVSIKDKTGAQIRLLKSNPHGIFATYSPLETGEYTFELEDPNSSYFFDTMNMHIEASGQPSLTFYSKEIL